MFIPQIKSSRNLEQVQHIEYDRVAKRFKKICSNTRKFNGRRLTYKTVTSGNGKQFKIYLNGNIIREISLLSDRYCWELQVIDFTQEK